VLKIDPPGADQYGVQGDRGRIVIGAITRIVVCLAIIVVLFHDGIVLGLGQVAVNQDAQVAARAAAQNWVANNDIQAAYDAAALAVVENGTDIDAATFKIDRSSNSVTLTARRETSTMVADHFSWFNSVTHPKGVASAAIAQP
jgi:hypothetical protein